MRIMVISEMEARWGWEVWRQYVNGVESAEDFLHKLREGEEFMVMGAALVLASPLQTGYAK